MSTREYGHTYTTSWGRTRGPKNLNEGRVGEKVQVLANTDTLVGFGASTVGYPTENQRYLHVLVEDATTSDNPGAVTIFGYCHAFQRWFPLPQSFDPVGTNATPTAATLDIGSIARAPAAQVPSDRLYRTYQIVGIDRVAFVCATAPAQVNVFAAGSTF